MIAPIKFKEGGATIFEDNIKSHHNLIEGINLSIPLEIVRQSRNDFMYI